MKTEGRILLGLISLVGSLLTSSCPLNASNIQLFGSHASGESFFNWGLVEFDTNPITGATTRIGAGGLMFDMDFSPDGILYAPGLATGAGAGEGLLTVDTTTGASTLVGPWGVTPTPLISAIAFSSNGTLYAHDNEGESTLLYTVDRSTGQLTTVGPIGDFAFGMDFGPHGKLYASTAGELYTINLETGAKDSTVGIPGLRIFSGLDFDADGILRGIDRQGTSTTDENDELWQIDPVDGTISLIGVTNESSMWGLASIPEPSTFVFATLGLLALACLSRRSDLKAESQSHAHDRNS